MTKVQEQSAPSGNASTATDPAVSNPARVHPAIAAAAPPVTGSSQPPTGVVTGPGGQKAVFMSEADYLKQSNKESHGFAIGVLLVGLLGAAGLSGYAAVELGGTGAAAGAAIFTLVWAAICTVVNFCAGWLVSKMFGTEYGSVGVMFLRFGAVTAATLFIIQMAGMAVGPMVALFLPTPVMLILAVVLVGMDMMQAFVYTVVVTMLNWMLFAFVMMSLASLMAM